MNICAKSEEIPRQRSSDTDEMVTQRDGKGFYWQATGFKDDGTVKMSSFQWCLLCSLCETALHAVRSNITWISAMKDLGLLEENQS